MKFFLTTFFSMCLAYLRSLKFDFISLSMLKCKGTLVGKSGCVICSMGCGAVPIDSSLKKLELRLNNSPTMLESGTKISKSW